MDGITVIKSNRKTLCIQIKSDLSIVVRAPRRVSNKEILRFLNEKEDWIDKTIKELSEKQKAIKNSEIEYFSDEELNQMAKEARIYIKSRVDYYSKIIGVDYSRITIRMQKTRWGSCSSKGGLNFNCLLMKTPKDVIDYVVVHELCHRLYMNHSAYFWMEVEKVLPGYKASRKWLKDNGHELMLRARMG